ncbi:MAG: cell division protein FtsZ [Bacteroidota bacterium]
MNQNNISFDLPKNRSNVIKVIGVGGGGSNAVNYMYNQGFNGVDFVVCNTDSQALQNSPVPNKIQLGVTLTEGLGAGADPEIGGQSAQESLEEIEAMFNTNTRMVFLTAGMGGGTGTGAAPVIAKLASKLGILTVGIVTIPFQFEGQKRLAQAQAGVEELRGYVDSLIVINNGKLREIYGNLGFKAGFSKADEVLATAAKGISQVITNHYGMNIDLRDAKTVLAKSGTAIMGSAEASGDNRAIDAITKALDSPLLNDNKITGAKKVLLLIVSGELEITLDEIGEINDYIQIESGGSSDIIMGVGDDASLGDSISVTVVATGFSTEQQDTHIEKEPSKTVHKLIEDVKPKRKAVPPPKAPVVHEKKEEIQEVVENKKVIHLLEEEVEEKPVVKPVVNEAPKTIEHEVKVERQEITPPVEESVLIEENIIEETPVQIEDKQIQSDIQEQSIESSTDENQQNSIMDIADEEIVINTIVSDVNISEEVVGDSQTTIEFDFEPMDSDEEIETEVIEDDYEEEVIEEVFEKKVVHRLEDFEEEIINDLPYIHSEAVESPDAHEVSDVANVPEVSNVTEVSQSKKAEVFSDGSKRYNLDDYAELETRIQRAKPVEEIASVQSSVEKVEVEPEPELKIEIVKKSVEAQVATEQPIKNVEGRTEADELLEESFDPTDVPLSKQDEIRKQRQERLRRFNHRFKATNPTAIDDLEKQPAYIRAGLDVTSSSNQNNNSRYSLRNSDDDNVIRSNNSFLHDNVD